MRCPYVVMRTFGGIDFVDVDEQGRRTQCVLDADHKGDHVTMICARCGERLVPVTSTKTLWAHDNGEHAWDHDAEPVKG